MGLNGLVLLERVGMGWKGLVWVFTDWYGFLLVGKGWYGLAWAGMGW